MARLTPMMQQYMQIKEQYKDALLFFRLGDFYEMFFDDAIICSRELEITLTGKDCGLEERAPMCGVPHHAVDNYLAKLIEKGYKVAICEQVQDPAEAKGIVERQVVRVVTPGTVIESSMLDDKSNNYLLSLYKDNNSEAFGFSWVDISTGEFVLSQISGEKVKEQLINEISKIDPKEVMINGELNLEQEFLQDLKNRFTLYITPYPEWAFQNENAYKRLLMHFNVVSLNGFGCENMEHGICAAGALIEYLSETQKTALSHINKIKVYYPQSYMVLDTTTRRNLELTETIRSKSKKGSLLWLLDKTNTAMGGRLLRQWVQQPLINKNQIEERLNAIEELIENASWMDELNEYLRNVYDMERLSSRISYGNANARDLLSLKQSIEFLPNIKDILSKSKSSALRDFYITFDILDDIYDLIDKSIDDNPPVTIKDGNIIKANYNSELDEYRTAMTEGKQWLASLESKEREKTGIKNLKIGYHGTFGYYLEVTKSYLTLVPDNYIRKQTLANSERYITPELKEIEDKILGAEEKSIKLEYNLFVEVRSSIAKEVMRIQHIAAIIANIDALLSLAKVSKENNYVKPEINDGGALEIVDGRHPVVEKTMTNGLFVPNNTSLTTNNDHLMIITGPNMAGKSTYMRQVAIIVLMAQIGCFIPAKSGQIGIVDRIFTRVGASDDLSSGQSTFMVEMNEVANILNNASSKSLLILDEIGRGTSTFDGLSIAWAVIEHICNEPHLKCKTLFATHYHELTELEGVLEGVKNYSILVKEHGDDIIFLRKIVQGGTDKSFGIQVAKLAGLPDTVLNRAKRILAQLEAADINNHLALIHDEAAAAKDKEKIADEKIAEQLSFFTPKESKVEKELKNININNLTPLEALNTLNKLVEMVNKE